MNLTDYLLERPWLADAPATATSGPGLLSEGECALLYTLARDYYSGEGSIVDLGCFLGRSTAALAYGLRDNPKVSPKPGVIYSYDKFSLPGGVEVYLEEYITRLGAKVEAGSEGLWFRPIFDRTIEPFADLVTTYEGSAPPLPYEAGPIEILFIDIVKTEALGIAVVETMFPHLIPGRSVVIQQDFHHYYGWFIHLCMDFFAEYFRIIVDAAGASCAFVCVKPIPPDLIAEFVGTPVGARYSLETGLEALTRMQRRLTPSYRFHLEMDKVRWRANLGEDISADVERLSVLPMRAGDLDGSWSFWIDTLRSEFPALSGASGDRGERVASRPGG